VNLKCPKEAGTNALGFQCMLAVLFYCSVITWKSIY
jgi:hypothetical protein